MQAPLFDWLRDRETGLLLHPTSLPGPLGIGDLGTSALSFLNVMAEAEIGIWQVLPLGPTGFGDSPYSAFSAFAGNPYLIDLQPLLGYGLLQTGDLDGLRGLNQERIDFGGLYVTKWPILRKAWRTFQELDLAYLPNYGLLEDFRARHAAWLEPFCLYMALKGHFNGASWDVWPAEMRSFQQVSKSKLPATVKEAARAQEFFQYLFFGQWGLVRRHAREVGVRIMGDMPIFVAYDSADVWANPELFDLGEDGKPQSVAGVPPDYFSPTGQLWGNPLYQWDVLQRTEYDWWLKRLALNFELYDLLRIDHFRGFHQYWEIPAEAVDAQGGQWQKGPGLEFFQAVKEHFPEAQIVAEDLGLIDEGVRDLRDAVGLPGMAILQFAFSQQPDNLYLPHNLTPQSVLYPGTHDNDTTQGWYDEAPEAERDQVRRYFRISGEEIAWDFIRAAYQSVSRLAIIPMQDFFSLGTDARMNAPGVPVGNWQWRATEEQLKQWREQSAPYLRELSWLYDRTPLKKRLIAREQASGSSSSK